MNARLLPAALLVAGALAYSSWVLDIGLVSGVDPLRGYVSELGARDRPLGALYRTADLIAALLVASAGAVVLQRPLHGRWQLFGWVALMVFAVATLLDSRWPMACAPSVHPGCDAGSAGSSMSETLHAIFSSVASTAALFAAACCWLAIRRIDAPQWRRLLSGGSVVVLVTATAWTLAAIALREQHVLYLGLAQRAQLIGTSAWLIVAALDVLWPARPANSAAVGVK